MKKFALFIIAILVVFFAYGYFFENNADKIIDSDSLEEGEVVVLQPQFDIKYDASRHSFKAETLMPDCSSENEIICAVEVMVKCSINPKMDTCTKERVPDFVFMEDESLGRPTEISYNIVKINPIDINTIEVQTNSDCDGTWFGLCKGKVIYVLDNKKGYFRVSDVYAIN